MAEISDTSSHSEAMKYVCVGEILWDSLPGGLFLGGAPFNVAVHLKQLGASVAVVTRVGDDRLGQEAMRRMNSRGLASSFVQVDGTYETGFVEVDMTQPEGPVYNIVEPVAWDLIEMTDEIEEMMQGCGAFVFGTLAQRNGTSRNTIQILAEAAPYCVLDVNIRSPYDNRSVIEDSLRLADLVKLNADELELLADWFGLPAAMLEAGRAISDRFSCETVCITRGDKGASLLHHDRWHHKPGHRVEVADVVGAGDAFLAALLMGLSAGNPATEALDNANRTGAYVAGRYGATPELPRTM